MDFPPVDTTSRQLTVRALGTGMLVGGVLSVCNIYTGLKIGWGLNMSITAALIGFAFWQGLAALARTPSFGLLENNVNQTAASAAASVSSAGLVAAVPALTLLTGHHFSWPVLTAWTLMVMMVGIVVGAGLRRQLLIVDKLPFPGGMATAETVKEMYARGAEAVSRVKVLLTGAVIATALKLWTTYAKIPTWPLPGSFAAKGALAKAGHSTVTLGNLTFALDPSPLMAAVGIFVGIRASASLFVGSLFAWGVLAPYALESGWATPGKPDPATAWFGPVLNWLLWPGVSMMVTASLTSFAFSWRTVLDALRRARGGRADDAEAEEVPRPLFLGSLVAVTALATIAQVAFFGITWWTALLGVLLTFILAIVAGRVSGETNVTPIGAMGKVTQLLFGVLQPGSAAANLMSANVTGGAASQTADLLHDMKTGLMIGASPRKQTVAQAAGALSGAVVGSYAYLVLFPDPKAQLLTPEWPAPAVASWKAVAEIFQNGIGAMPEKAGVAMVVAGAAGVLLAVLEKLVPPRAAKWLPSPASLGLAFVIPGHNAISMMAGATLGVLVSRVAKEWSTRFLIVLAAGFVAGESLTGVGIALQKILYP